LEELGAKIRRERKAMGLTLERLAKLVGTSRASMQRIEKGIKSPSVALLAEISQVLRKPINHLLSEEKRGLYKFQQKKKIMIAKGIELKTICPFGFIYRDLVINYFKARAGAIVKPHHDNGYEWVCMIKGSCVFEYNGVPNNLKKGDVIYYDARETHSVKVLTNLESIDIFIRI